MMMSEDARSQLKLLFLLNYNKTNSIIACYVIKILFSYVYLRC